MYNLFKSLFFPKKTANSQAINNMNCSAKYQGVTMDFLSDHNTLPIGTSVEVDIEGEGLGKRGDQWVEVLSIEPKAFLYHNFLSKEECDYLINLARPHLKRSLVQHAKTGKGIISSGRTSTGMSLRRGQDKVIRAIEKRIADFTCFPVEHGENLQVIHYEVGQKTDLHSDSHEINTKNGAHRKITFLMYLSDVEEGGETVFPYAKGNFARRNEGSTCDEKGLVLKPKLGDAVFFWNLRPDGTVDPNSWHKASPIIKGEKWACTKWIRVGEFKI